MPHDDKHHHQKRRPQTEDEIKDAIEGQRTMFTQDQIRAYEQKCIRDSIAYRYPAGMTDRQIAEAYRRETQSRIIVESMRKDRSELDEEMIRYMNLECHGIDELLKRGEANIPELHDSGRWVCFLTQLEWDEMTPEEWAEEEAKVDRLVAEQEAQEAGEGAGLE